MDSDIGAGPETHRELVTMLTQLYGGLGGLPAQFDVSFPDNREAVTGLAAMFLYLCGGD